MRLAASIAAGASFLLAGLTLALTFVPSMGVRLLSEPTISSLLVSATLLMAAATLMMYGEAHEARLLQLRPFVSVRFEINPINGKVVDVNIVNDGFGPARDVTFAVVEGDFLRWVGSGRRRKVDQAASDFSVFRHGLPYLGPGQAVRVPFTHAASLRERPENERTLTVKAAFNDVVGKRHETTFETDFSEFSDFSRLIAEGSDT